MHRLSRAALLTGTAIVAVACTASDAGSGSVEPSAAVSRGGEASTPPPSAAPSEAAMFAPETSDGGEIVGTVTPSEVPPPVGELHTWVLHLEDTSGTPIEGAIISVDGDMPAHGHGLPTQPQVTDDLGDGDYLVEGMEFQMGGEWYVEFTITTPEIDRDTLRFDFELPM